MKKPPFFQKDLAPQQIPNLMGSLSRQTRNGSHIKMNFALHPAENEHSPLYIQMMINSGTPSIFQQHLFGMIRQRVLEQELVKKHQALTQLIMFTKEQEAKIALLREQAEADKKNGEKIVNTSEIERLSHEIEALRAQIEALQIEIVALTTLSQEIFNLIDKIHFAIEEAIEEDLNEMAHEFRTILDVADFSEADMAELRQSGIEFTDVNVSAMASSGIFAPETEAERESVERSAMITFNQMSRDAQAQFTAAFPEPAEMHRALNMLGCARVGQGLISSQAAGLFLQVTRPFLGVQNGHMPDIAQKQDRVIASFEPMISERLNQEGVARYTEGRDLRGLALLTAAGNGMQQDIRRLQQEQAELVSKLDQMLEEAHRPIQRVATELRVPRISPPEYEGPLRNGRPQ